MTTKQRTSGPEERIDWVGSLPFLFIHLTPVLAIWTGFTRSDLILCALLFVGRMFFVTAGYHRYFSHRAYRTGRVFQFLLGLGGTLALQKGPLWWAAYHRHHHKYSDGHEDIHSPLKGFWWSHVGWILCPKYEATSLRSIEDFARYPELLWLNRNYWVPPACLGLFCFLAGGASTLVVGFLLSTVLLYHCTFAINSLAHVIGRRAYPTRDESRNSFVLAVLTLGEGWHNNHHYSPSSARQGFRWWQIDLSYYMLKMLSLLGLVWDLRPAPATRHSSRPGIAA